MWCPRCVCVTSDRFGYLLLIYKYISIAPHVNLRKSKQKLGLGSVSGHRCVSLSLHLLDLPNAKPFSLLLFKRHGGGEHHCQVILVYNNEGCRVIKITVVCVCVLVLVVVILYALSAFQDNISHVSKPLLYKRKG